MSRFEIREPSALMSTLVMLQNQTVACNADHRDGSVKHLSTFSLLQSSVTIFRNISIFLKLFNVSHIFILIPPPSLHYTFLRKLSYFRFPPLDVSLETRRPHPLALNNDTIHEQSGITSVIFYIFSRQFMRVYCVASSRTAL